MEKLAAQSTTEAPAGMAWIQGGSFLMGSDDFYAEERPVRRVEVEGFWIDTHPVTVAQFRRFVKETGYVTVAERPPRAEDYPAADPALLVPGSLVFQRPGGPVSLTDYRAWWAYVPGAQWRRPEGPGLGRLFTRASSRHARRLRGRRGVRAVGGARAADRGRVGVRRPRRARRRPLRLG